MLEIVPADTPSQLATVRELFLEYADSLNFELNFQSFDRDINELPGKYAPPEGRLYLARWDGKVAGCIALKKLGPDTCELKRLWVKPAFRGKKIGRALAERVIADAREIGYRKMMLDTIDTMIEAMTLYQSLGFEKTVPYYDNPVKGATHFEKCLTESEDK
ncbi:MAG: GNAT family N-acetyltransferase [Candidatus Zixiibacteriota bacterium]|nr:MAG: GNAT family N-acetyltransferase [candidate division Zixibacteria bacterium]